MKTFLTTCHEEKHCIWSNFRYYTRRCIFASCKLFTGTRSVQDLIIKMGQLCKNPFRIKHMKRRLLDHYGENVIFTAKHSYS